MSDSAMGDCGNMAPLSLRSVLTSGKTKMPVLGIGTWQGTNEEVEVAVDAALEAGYRHIDTASSYGNEEGIGKVLKKWFDSGKLKREDIFVVTKCNPTHFRPEHIEKSLDASLARLGLPYVDLYLAHMPVGLAYAEVGFVIVDGKVQVDMSTDLIANWKVMEGLVDSGKTKAIGVSNFSQSQVKRILDAARIKPVNNQVEMNVYLQQPELVKFCKDNDVIMCAYSPIGSPNLVKFNESRGMTTDGMNIVRPLDDPVVLEIAKKHGKSAAQILLRFLLQYGVAAIPKSSNPERVKHNADIFDFELSNEEFSKLKSLDKGAAGRQFGGDKGFFEAASKHPEYSLK